MGTLIWKELSSLHILDSVTAAHYHTVTHHEFSVDIEHDLFCVLHLKLISRGWGFLPSFWDRLYPQKQPAYVSYKKLRCPQRLGKLLSFLYWYSIDDELSVHYQCIECPVRNRVLWEDKSSVITRLVFAQSTPNVGNFFCCDIHTCNSWDYTRQKK